MNIATRETASNELARQSELKGCLVFCSAVLSVLGVARDAGAASAGRAPAGVLKDGTLIESITLSNERGLSARILSYGATLQSLMVPDRYGKAADIVLGFDTVAEYEAAHAYFGATIGRYANRLAKGRFTLDGVSYQLPTNDGMNSLHGGGAGFDRKAWAVWSILSGAVASVAFGLKSPDGDSGYPGEVNATVTYSLDEVGNLTILFTATTSKPTILNMTNHALFALAGEGAPQGAMPEKLTIAAAAYTPVDATLIPTGELRRTEGSVFSFATGRILAEGLRDGREQQIRLGRGYDHNFVLAKGQTVSPQLAARLEDPASGRVLEVLTTEPGLQLYTGNFLDGTVVGKRGHLYRMGDGIALEPQKFPDTPNKPAFGSARVDPAKPYRHEMIYRLSVAR
jgi:aldose 1-epimerase